MSSRRQVMTYVFFVFLFSSVFYLLVIHAKHLAAGAGLYVVAIMWCPSLAAFTTLKLIRTASLCGDRTSHRLDRRPWRIPQP